MKKLINKKEYGFTLIELIIASTLFVSVVGVALGALTLFLNANIKSQKGKDTLYTVDATLETMSRELRLGHSYRCGSNITNVVEEAKKTGTSDCESGNFISFKKQGSDDDRTVYFFHDDKLESAKVKCDPEGDPPVEKCNVNATDFKEFVGEGVTLESVRFRVTGAADTDTTQPSVDISLSGTYDAGNQEGEKISIRTSVTQRRLDIKRDPTSSFAVSNFGRDATAFYGFDGTSCIDEDGEKVEKILCQNVAIKDIEMADGSLLLLHANGRLYKMTVPKSDSWRIPPTGGVFNAELIKFSDENIEKIDNFIAHPEEKYFTVLPQNESKWRLFHLDRKTVGKYDEIKLPDICDDEPPIAKGGKDDNYVRSYKKKKANGSCDESKIFVKRKWGTSPEKTDTISVMSGKHYALSLGRTGQQYRIIELSRVTSVGLGFISSSTFSYHNSFSFEDERYVIGNYVYNRLNDGYTRCGVEERNCNNAGNKLSLSGIGDAVFSNPTSYTRILFLGISSDNVYEAKGDAFNTNTAATKVEFPSQSSGVPEGALIGPFPGQREGEIRFKKVALNSEGSLPFAVDVDGSLYVWGSKVVTSTSSTIRERVFVQRQRVGSAVNFYKIVKINFGF
ncbi:MAG: prepilin-type N-terminal cleavage/methylation domain-containing protein [Candidatus Campbellbacteria bacterium]|nr:prepilin-type N-terminal cleavage/methylation domain-containing protein [Candidatus Campbellbacteria bacterium]